MSIDLSLPLVPSTGQQDALEGLITCLELQTAKGLNVEGMWNLTTAIADMTAMSADGHGAQTTLSESVATEFSLQEFVRSSLLRRPAEHRLAFRELGLSIGLQGLPLITRLVARDSEPAAIGSRLLHVLPLAEQISSFWSKPDHRLSSMWTEHRDINTVMLATSLAPEGYLRL
jgi:hypothetical protein